ncbi:MAG: hypothetical protein KIT66_08340 [Chitinophagaceae bacterium]|nr:hypothetical protein [Chitinophagaceae bacterium]MCZ2395291.1 hypothetical protein [Chitinophagales bacterium]
MGYSGEGQIVLGEANNDSVSRIVNENGEPLVVYDIGIVKEVFNVTFSGGSGKFEQIKEAEK